MCGRRFRSATQSLVGAAQYLSALSLLATLHGGLQAGMSVAVGVAAFSAIASLVIVVIGSIGLAADFAAKTWVEGFQPAEMETIVQAAALPRRA